MSEISLKILFNQNKIYIIKFGDNIRKNVAADRYVYK